MKFGKKLKIFSKKNLIVNSIPRKYLKAKIKSYNGKININFHDNETPREGSQCICLSVILINSVCKTGKNYYPQVFLEKRKYVIKNKKIPKYIIDNIEISSDSDEENSDEESSDEVNSDKENFEEENFDEENSDEKKRKNTNVTNKKKFY